MMDMEVDLFSNVVSEEDTVEVDIDNDNFGDKGERCGICMDIVVDRGVLDCCQHWFCFVCIDNWATITNLCPLCQNEFQLITCLPVYDTIGTAKTDEDLDSRDDDWHIEGENNTLSFPSYYIDENAVTCLDGGGCKIRTGSLSPEEALLLDTSIACDSCDIWYHAFCVGFDTEGADVESWLCPRCNASEVEQKAEFKILSSGGQLCLEYGDRSLVDTCSGKVSISVADGGETALVISRIDGKDSTKESIIDHLSAQEGVSADCISSELIKPLKQMVENDNSEPTVPRVKLEECAVKCEPYEDNLSMTLDLGVSLASTSSDGLPGDASDKNLPPDEDLNDVKTDAAPKLVKNRKCAQKSYQLTDGGGCSEVELASGSSSRKTKAQKRTEMTLNDQDNGHTSTSLHENDLDVENFADEIKGKSPSIDIMSIVKGAEPRTGNGPMPRKKAAKGANGEKTAARLRVKKIMRRPSDNKESDEVVQSLRKEIRQAVQNKSSDDTGKLNVDTNLLAAFRVAVAEPAKIVSSVNVKAKKLMLQKGKARENLTKKIYATSNGKRRRAWDRDCEVEFWKHRCLTTSKPEKIAALKSVLSLLQKNPETKVVQPKLDEEAEAPILSRLYLADASLFPRKDDIKPLSALKATTDPTQSGAISSGQDIKVCPESVKSSTTTERAGESNTSVDGKNKKSTFHSGGHSDKSSSFKKNTGKTDDVKIDKRKWALEVLARKTASSNTSSAQQKQDDTVLKGNYPLLAELPTDLKPKLASTRHNKLPASVRQAQLYRLTEHYLKMTNLPTNRRTAATELAVADAINIEKQVAERSSSKVVYLNLCSQEIRRHTNSDPCSPAEGTPSSPSLLPAEGQQICVPTLSTDTEAALRAAGLLTDSPPSSPLHKIEGLDGGCGSPLAEVKEDETENILEMDCNPDIDIYGDFDYDLDEEDYIGGASAINSSKLEAEEGEAKVKVVFSTLSLNKSEIDSEVKEQTLPTTSSSVGCLSDTDIGKTPISKIDSVPLPLAEEDEELSLAECEALYGPDKEPPVIELPELMAADTSKSESARDLDSSNPDTNHHLDGEKLSSSSQAVENIQGEKKDNPKDEKSSERSDSVLKKVEAYIKEHIRPLCKSGVITVDQYRWAVAKTTAKVMKHHTQAKSANFLIKEGDKVKKLATQYIEAAKHKGK